ncbi:MAG: B12-binding domain-containing radical SAM protein, partial [Candidatus Helarchaeales archaeon]
MKFDVVLATLPSYNTFIPSLSLATLQAYLIKKGLEVHCIDFSYDFYKQNIDRFSIPDNFSHPKETRFGNWGYSNWYVLKALLNLTHHQVDKFIESLGPVCSKLYQPIFQEFVQQADKTFKILNSYVEYIEKFQSELYAFSLVVGNAPATMHVCARLKERHPECKIVLGGPEVNLIYRSNYYARFPFIDAVVHHHEGEIPLYQIVQAIKEKSRMSKIPGITLQTEKGLKSTENPPILDPNENLIPSYDLLDLVNHDIKNVSSLRVVCSKGCPSQCLFCNDNSIWGPFRSKKPEKIAREIEYFAVNLGIKNIVFADNSFNAVPVLEKTFELLNKKKIEISWGGNAEFRKFSTAKIKLLKKYGMSFCYLGLESGSPKILHLMNKKIDLQHASRVLKSLHENNIKTGIYVLVGFPGETKNDFLQTLKFIDQHSDEINDFLVSVFTLQRGSAIFNSPLVIPIQVEPK